MDEAGCKFWLRNVGQRRYGGQRRERSLLVWDSLSAHLTDCDAAEVKASNTDVAVIPGGLPQARKRSSSSPKPLSLVIIGSFSIMSCQILLE